MSLRTAVDFKSYLILIPATILANINCLHGEFVFDDSEAVVNNPDVSGGGSWKDIFDDDFWGTPLHKESSHGSYRPIITVIYRVLWHSMRHACYFRLLNLLIHCAVTTQLYRTLKIALDLQYDHLHRYRKQVALLAALLFAVHPIHTESLCSAVGIADLLCALFYLQGIQVYLQWTKDHESKSLPTKLAIYSALSMFSKEPGVMLLGVCGAYELLVICDIVPHHLVSKYKTFINSFKKTSVIRFAFCGTIGVLLLFLRCLVVNFKAPTFQPMDNPASFLSSPLLRSINYQYIYLLNFLLLVFPKWLCFDWSMGCVPLITGVRDYRIILLVALWAILTSIAFVISRDTSPRRGYCLASALLIIPFLPSSNIFIRVGFVIAERNLYLSSMGFCLFLSISFLQVWRKFCHQRTLFQFAVGFLILLLIGRSLRRSRDWSEERTLFNSGLDVCPLNAKVHYNIAKVTDNKTAAIESYKTAIQLNPVYDQAMNNLANIYKDMGLLNEAQHLLEKVITIRPKFSAAWMNLGIVEAALQNYQRSEYCYLKAIGIRKKYPNCFFNLGNLYLEIKDHPKALSAFKQALSQAPDHLLSWNNMVILLDSLGRFKEAEEAAREGLRQLKDAPSLHFHLGNILGKMENFDESEFHFLRAIALKEDATYHSNLGVLYHRWGHGELARREYLKAIQLNPRLKSVKENLAKLERGQKRRR